MHTPGARGYERAGAAVALATAVPLAYLTLAYLPLAGRKQAMARIGRTHSALIDDALAVAAGAAVVALALRQGALMWKSSMVRVAAPHHGR